MCLCFISCSAPLDSFFSSVLLSTKITFSNFDFCKYLELLAYYAESVLGSTSSLLWTHWALLLSRALAVRVFLPFRELCQICSKAHNRLLLTSRCLPFGGLTQIAFSSLTYKAQGQCRKEFQLEYLRLKISPLLPPLAMRVQNLRSSKKYVHFWLQRVYSKVYFKVEVL